MRTPVFGGLLISDGSLLARACTGARPPHLDGHLYRTGLLLSDGLMTHGL